MDPASLLITLSIITGQLIKLPVNNLGVTLLDTVVIALCLLGLQGLKFHLKKAPLWIKTSLLFILIATLSLLLTPLHLDTTQKLTSLAYTLRFFDIILLGWLIYSGSFSVFKKNIPQILTVSGMGLAILGLLQLIFLPDLRFLSKDGWDPHFFRVVSSFLDPNFVGAYLVLTLLLICHSRESGNLVNKFISWIPHQAYSVLRYGVWNDKVVFAIVYTSLLTTFSRGAYLMFGVSFLFLALLNKSIRLIILTGILSAGLLLGFFIYHRVVAEPKNIDRTKSAEYRLDSWQQGLKLFIDHPILGVGYNAYRYALKEYSLAGDQFLASRGASSNDSSLLFVAATTGLIGLISYLFFLGSIIWTALSHSGGRKPLDSYTLVAGLVGLITQSFFANTLFYPFLLIWVILMASDSLGKQSK